MSRTQIASPPRSARILVIDDDHSFRRLIYRMYVGSLYQVESAASIQEGHRILLEESFDLVILDHAFPSGKGGLKFLKTLKKEPKTRDIPVMFATGEATGEETAQALDLGAADCIVKPFSTELFKAKIERLLSKTPERKPRNKDAARPLILHVEDRDDWTELVRAWLKSRGIAVHSVTSRKDMRRFLAGCEQLPDCIVMDVGLPDADGLEICDEIKASPMLQRIPIILLTAQEHMQLAGFRHQALHVVQKTKRKGVGELFLATVDSVLTQQERTLGVLAVGDLKIDPRNRHVYHGNKLICTPNVQLFRILRCLVERSPLAVPADIIRRASRQRSNYHRRHPRDPKPKTVEVYISTLRGLLGDEVAPRIVCARQGSYAYIPPDEKPHG